GTKYIEREGKTVYTGSTMKKPKGFDTPVRIAYKVIERTVLANGQILLVPDVTVDTYWVSLPDPADTVIGLYHEHGTSEQFHSEFKTDLDLERLPSGKFATNALILLLGILITIASRLVYHARQYKLRFGRFSPWLNTFKQLYAVLRA
ncbi:IS1380 family transposase, partial [Thermodesulfovibrionales bacterium]|nr:IS1380 family transposase [Thermodesulfovibrionales bacterium]